MNYLTRCTWSDAYDAIVTNIGEGRKICIKSYPYIDIPFSAFGTFLPGTVFSANLTDATNSFTTQLPGCELHSPGNVNTFSGSIHCHIPSSVPLGPNYRIRIDSDIPSIIGEPSPYDIEIVGTCNDQRNALTVANVELFPNPASGKISILFLKKESSKIDITFYDVQGRKCIVKHFSHESNSESFDISMLKDGLYIISIKNGEQTIQKKLIVSNY